MTSAGSGLLLLRALLHACIASECSPSASSVLFSSMIGADSTGDVLSLSEFHQVLFLVVLARFHPLSSRFTRRCMKMGKSKIKT